MTREDKIDAFAMYLDGATMEEIGSHYGVSKQWISHMLANPNGRGGQRGRRLLIIYPRLAQWMQEKHLSAKALSKRIGVPYNSVLRYLNGKSSPSVDFIRAVLRETGLPFEEAFMKEDGQP